MKIRQQIKALGLHKNVAAKSRELTAESCPYIFSLLSSYFTVPFLSFWRVTSPLL